MKDLQEINKLVALKELLDELNVKENPNIHKVYFKPLTLGKEREFVIHISADNLTHDFSCYEKFFRVNVIGPKDEDSFSSAILVYSDCDFEVFEPIDLDCVLEVIGNVMDDLGPSLEEVYFKPENILEDCKPVITFKTSSDVVEPSAVVYKSVVYKIDVFTDVGGCLWKRN